jgi:thiol-disulfide isomerase/thioredoxin
MLLLCFLFLSLSCTKKNDQSNADNQLKMQVAESVTFNGDKIPESSLQGKIIILNFWASWCPACMQETPSLLKLVKKFPKGVVLISVSEDESAKEMQKFLKLFPTAKSANVFLIHDQSRKWSQKYNIYKLPETYVYGRDFKLIQKFEGSISFENPQVESFFFKLINN